MKKLMLAIIIIVGFGYIVACGLLYYFQEKIIFLPQKLDKDYQFDFGVGQKFEEIRIKADDGALLNGLLFSAKKSKGLIFYMHGNAGSLKYWGNIAKTYTDLNYDIFILDYRSFGKSQGNINSQNQLFADNQAAYDELKKRYSEDKIIVLGYSIGTGFAAKLAATNQPKLLILQAPYYNLTDLMQKTYPLIPTILLKYKFDTNQYLKQCTMPVVVFHGDEDDVIYYGSSLKLQQEFKPQDRLITLHEQGHHQMTDNPQYQMALAKLLAQ